MKADELRAIMYRKPFQPFRIRLKDGRTFDIHYPRLNLVGESVILIGTPPLGDSNPRFSERHDWVMLKLIDGIEFLPEPAAPAHS